MVPQPAHGAAFFRTLGLGLALAIVVSACGGGAPAGSTGSAVTCRAA